MKQLTRRNFLKTLAGLPALLLVKPKVAEVESVEVELVPVDEVVYPREPERVVSWNGEKWARLDTALEFGTEGELYIQGSFLSETPEQVRRRHQEHRKRLTT